MKKIFTFLTCLCLGSLLLSGCASKDPVVNIADGVSFELKDVMTITNDESNSIYYYYMATITNDSKETYSTNAVIYTITDDGDDNIHPIDQHESMPINTVLPDQTAYVYGYIGFPNNNQKDMGFYFNDLDLFLSFNNVNVRKADNKDIKDSKEDKFTIYEDNALKIDIDGTKTKTTFSNGSTQLTNFIVTYTNKTDKQIVVPYFEPKATLLGLNLTDYSSLGDFSNMNEEQLKDVDFKSNGLSPKTSEINGDAYGYVVEYLDPEQSIDCKVGFTFENGAINYSNDSKDCFQIDLVSSAFGITHSMELSY